jgi:hypothetical protein
LVLLLPGEILKNMRLFFLFLFLCFGSLTFAQSQETLDVNKVTVHQDYRMEILGRKESDLNTAILKNLARIGKGYRLMVLNTYDRAYAMKIRGQLLEKFPEQKTYMWFANPYIKIKFGNFKNKDEAESYRRQISKMMNGATIYLLPDNIEVKPDKDFNPDEMNN